MPADLSIWWHFWDSCSFTAKEKWRLEEMSDVINPQALVGGATICINLWPTWKTMPNLKICQFLRLKNVPCSEYGIQKIQLETSYGTSSHKSWPWNHSLDEASGIIGLFLLANQFFCVRLTLLHQMETHSCSSASCWLHLSGQSESLITFCLMYLFIYLFFLVREKRACSGSGVCMYIEPHRWSQRGQREGVMLLKSTTPICLSVRCLAWLSSTQWWCRQNDRRDAHSSECQFGCKAPLP